MKDKNNKRKSLRRILVLTALVLIIGREIKEKIHDDNFKIEYKDEYEDNPYYFASYSKGNIYFCPEECVKDITCINKNDIIVIDERFTKDPNLVVLNSCNIRNRNDIREILCILQAYNNADESGWRRTIPSMENEWFVHNLLYDFNYKLDHTTDVDFNNADEETFKSKLLHFIIK